MENEETTLVTGLDPMEGLFTCERCDTAQVEEDQSEVFTRFGNPAQWCLDCTELYARYCDCCETRYDASQLTSTTVTRNGERENWCYRCVDEHAGYCDRCDTYEDEDDRCESDEVELFAYNHKPRFRHIFAPGEDTSVRTYGIELEMEPTRNNGERKFLVETIEDTFGNDFYCKEDGSLTQGVELVSHPHSLKQWYNLSDELQNVLRDSAEQGLRAWTQSQCGLHIHIGWDHFSPSHAMRFTLLFARNETKWVEVANRRSRYANFNGIQGGVAMKVKNHDWANHFDAVNLGGNGGKTIEVRIWRPSMAVGRILGSIELVDASYEYTRNMTAHDAINGGLDFANFAEFVESEGNWPNAVRIIKNQRFNLKKGL